MGVVDLQHRVAGELAPGGEVLRRGRIARDHLQHLPGFQLAELDLELQGELAAQGVADVELPSSSVPFPSFPSPFLPLPSCFLPLSSLPSFPSSPLSIILPLSFQSLKFFLLLPFPSPFSLSFLHFPFHSPSFSPPILPPLSLPLILNFLSLSPLIPSYSSSPFPPFLLPSSLPFPLSPFSSIPSLVSLTFLLLFLPFLFHFPPHLTPLPLLSPP